MHLRHFTGSGQSAVWGENGVRMSKLKQEEITNLVSFLPAVEAFLWLWTLVNPVAFLPAPPALLRLRAVRCKVALLVKRVLKEILKVRG